ncbi:MAG: hypothetical protein AB7N65_21400, partial [Vicinamibacterales bacterium]
MARAMLVLASASTTLAGQPPQPLQPSVRISLLPAGPRESLVVELDDNLLGATAIEATDDRTVAVEIGPIHGKVLNQLLQAPETSQLVRQVRVRGITHGTDGTLVTVQITASKPVVGSVRRAARRVYIDLAPREGDGVPPATRTAGVTAAPRPGTAASAPASQTRAVNTAAGAAAPTVARTATAPGSTPPSGATALAPSSGSVAATPPATTAATTPTPNAALTPAPARTATDAAVTVGAPTVPTPDPLAAMKSQAALLAGRGDVRGLERL